MSKASYEFGVVCEARADQLTACAIADRVMLQEIDWLTPESLEQVRRWRGAGSLSDEQFVRWQNVRKELARRGIPIIFGSFGEDAGGPDAYITRQALLLLASDPERCPDAVLLVRDSDGDTNRRQGLIQARENPRVSRARSDTRPWPFQVVIALAHPKREAWVMAGFRPGNPDEEERLRMLKARLSLDPVQKSHELDAREHGAKTDIKRALRHLIPDDWNREQQCLEETPLDLLEQRGQDNGMAPFLAEVRERLVPILDGTGRAG
jgi:hypothetical protein